MLMVRTSSAVSVRAPAKVNLFLEVLGKRPDGFHEIATLMVAVNLYDGLTFTEAPAGRLVLTCDDPRLSVGPDNLVWRAADRLRQRTGCNRGAHIHLTKRIPMAAGLAGGSSDAAATLAGLNALWDLGLETPKLAEIAAEIGSDIAFFFATPAAWCTGRGEVVEPAPLGRSLDFLLVCPSVGLSTADVYRNVTVPQRAESGDAIRRALAQGDVAGIGRNLHNRLQAPAERLSPTVGELARLLDRHRPTGARMSGSGSSLFALGRDRQETVRLARALRRAAPSSPGVPGGGLRLFLVRSCV
jgi:4-diphosphocytidyl-2-C-methyl-D-erythritol kinase